MGPISVLAIKCLEFKLFECCKDFTPLTDAQSVTFILGASPHLPSSSTVVSYCVMSAIAVMVLLFWVISNEQLNVWPSGLWRQHQVTTEHLQELC